MKRRTVNVFGLSFLDVMFCGFGSVILLVMIVNADTVTRREELTEDLQAEAERLEKEVFEGRRGLVELKNALQDIEQERVKTEGLSKRVIATIKQTKLQLAELDHDTLARVEHVHKLKSDLKSLDEDRQRLEGSTVSQRDQGDKARSFLGQGDRQYLTGIKMGGDRILILIDASASMLDETIVNILRRRHMPEARKLEAPKWRRVVSTVEWLVSQLPRSSKYQVYTFNDSSKPLLSGTDTEWLDASDSKTLEEVVQSLRKVIPQKGTSLHKAFASFKAMRPLPDNVFLVTDGLPTQGQSKPWGKKVTAEKRLRHFEEAARAVPRGVPVNVILFPIEGDPLAASAYWKLAGATNGAFVSPAEDWP